MRILIIPNLTFRRVYSESEFLMFRNFIRSVRRKRDDIFFYMLLPAVCRSEVDQNEIDGVHFVFDDSNKVGYYNSICKVPEGISQFDVLNGKYPVDAVLTSRPEAAPYIHRNLNLDPKLDMTRIPVFVDESMAPDRRGEFVYPRDKMQKMRAFGYSFCKTFFDTEWEAERAKNISRKFLAPSEVQKVRENSEVVPCGVDVDRLKRIRENTEKHDKLTIVFSGRLNVIKGQEFVIEFMDKIFQLAFPVNIKIFTQNLDRGRKLQKKYDGLDIQEGMNGDRFLRELAKCHLGFSASLVEGFSMGHVEMSYLLDGIIMPDRRWVDELLVGYDGEYPFIYNDVKEALSMVKSINENREEAKQKMAPIRQYIEDNLNCRDCFLRMYDSMKKDVDAIEFDEPLEKLKDLLDRMPGGECTLDSVYDLLNKDATRDMNLGAQFYKFRRFYRFFVYKQMKQLGFKDKCDSYNPVFVRPDNE